MQHVQKFETLGGQRLPVVPLQVTTVRPSLWERVKTWTTATLTPETVTEALLSMATIALMGWHLFGLYFALERYTIIPLP
jgi:hypothetical protein